MQKEFIELLKKEGKRKESSFTAESIPIKETMTIPRIFRQKGSPSPFSRLVSSSTPFTEQRPNNLTKKVAIHSQPSSPLQQEILTNNKPIFNIRTKDYNLWFVGIEVDRFIGRVRNIPEIEGASGRDIARQISFWNKDQDISFHI
ncbi:hypothetical protein O181_027280 [Austropuccinia psidii MF-1]|uniref:Uncharacterized protein n=1 Tax=Austropuccinia psidii MF-1 TaxID=1389203 RepID=A0A9Q3CR30_9BASI|nr:hypothetical protein [Austropuccinia psidii MF-1]